MEGNWDSAIVKMWKEQEAKNGLNVSVLKPGTKVIVETHNSFYEFEVIEGKLVKVFGGTMKDGNTRFPKAVEAIIYGSTWGGALLKIDWIGIDMRLEFRERGQDKMVTTSPVRRITVEGNNWTYSLT